KSFKELKVLADEVRQRIIEVTSVNGGHVASSLGATDLIIALLKVFSPPKDSIIFDVGHQSYAYKILTGRNKQFDTLRSFKGISGFNNIFESEYDAFSVGHSSTSLSAALGITIAKEATGDKSKTIAVIGDGALTGGMAFEGLNHAGSLQKNMIVVLNDNKMSISPNVGALQHYLTNVLVSKPYNSVKKQVWDLSASLPDRIRKTLITSAQKVEESLINIFVPNIIFEDLGFKYVGPIDGHDIPRMCRVFHQVKDNMEGPVLIHLITQKGKGLPFAEEEATRFHGIAPYDKTTGETDPAKNISYSQVFGSKLVELGRENDKIVAITAAMTDGTGLCDFAKEFPKRFFDVGIAEQHAVTFAAGLAIKGLKPFVAIYSTFLQRAFDQIIHDVALQKLPVVFCIDRAGIVGEDGATHHGVFDISYLQMIPNLVIVAPSSGDQLESVMKWAATYDKGPVAIRYPRGIASYGEKKEIIPFKAEVYRKGKGVAITGVGHSYILAKLVYDKLAINYPDLRPCLINPVFLKPFDHITYNIIYRHCKYHFVMEENAQIGGFASYLSIRYDLSDCKTISCAIKDKFLPHGVTGRVRKSAGLTADKVYEDIIKIIIDKKETK
ncbi:MAG: 1-deoxy-D-xylulose-5-phosphate synthase, partial [Candidatus Cloacimonetes bacterium]|nr:1-deoxy-D-xylulose-5-phosphate synthase [Candidatus Cloacimonadota bacterium]